MDEILTKHFQEWYEKQYGDIPEYEPDDFDDNGHYTEYGHFLHCQESFVAGHKLVLDSQN